MKKTLCFAIFCFFVCSAIAEVTIKIENGVSFSSFTTSLYKNAFDTYPKALYSGTIGADYLEHEYWALSSEIGLTRRGDGCSISIFDENGDELSQTYHNFRLNYLHLNTTFRIKQPYNNFTFFCGIGPKLDILLNSHGSDNITIDPYVLTTANMKKFLWGLKPEIGVYYTHKHLRVGANASYMWELSYLDEIGNKLRCTDFVLMFSLGYRIYKN